MMNEGRAPKARALVKRTARGWEASFDQLLVGIFASEELAKRCLDTLRLKAAVDGGQRIAEVELLCPLQVRYNRV
jgi:hypothetical protein